MQAARFEGHAQRPARPEQVVLTDHLVEMLRAQPLGQRRVGRRRGATRFSAACIEQRFLRAHRFIVAARAPRSLLDHVDALGRREAEGVFRPA